jgi:RNA polymerase sigma factor (TIGR02999 family)
MYFNEGSNMDPVVDLFDNWKRGDVSAGDKLFVLLYDDLSKIARALLRNERQLSLCTGEIINEAVLRIMRSQNLSIVSEAHLRHLASRVMRNILLDNIKKKNRIKNHNGILLSLNADKEGDKGFSIQFLELEHTISRLEIYRTDLADITTMKVYGAMSNDDIALVLGKTREQVKYAWKTAKIWLIKALQDNEK